MEFPQDNPIVKLWEEIKAASGTLEDAIERVTAPEFAEALTEADVIGLGKTCEEARGLDDRPEDLTPLARLNFEGARAGDGVSEAAKRATAVCYLNVAPTVGPVALRAQHDVATAALGWADRDGDPALWASLRSHQGDALDSLGERHAAKVAFDDALGIYMALAEGEPQAFRDHVAMTYNNLGNVLSDIGERQEAEHAFGKALHIYRTLAKEEAPAFRPEVAMVLNNLGNVLRAVGKQQNAKSACHEALGLYETLADEEPGKFRDDVAMAHNNLGSVLSDMGERQEAMDECQKALDLYRTLADGGSEEFVPDVAGALSNVSVLQGHTDDPQGALESAEEAADIAKGCGAGKIEALARQAQGKALTALSRHNEARRAYERAYDLASAQTDLAQAQTNAKWIDAVCLNAKPDVVCRRLWDDFGQDLAEMAETKAKSDELVEVNIKRQASLSRGAGKGELVIARQWASFT
ncbi:MAG TPA: tetratricopeptide repeat-containing protein, partial [Armatimonadota bacterium]|nr:tetratricopeptide repeat-containing protein [Armatimonadota bacterium]